MLELSTVDCPFCTQEDVKSRIIFENELVFCFPTKTPVVPGHTLICPRRHLDAAEHLSKEELFALFELRRRLSTAMKKVFKAKGFNYAWNEGEMAGQSVPHLHLHMLPREKGDAGIYNYEPRKFLYRPGSRPDSTEKELLEVSILLKKAL